MCRGDDTQTSVSLRGAAFQRYDPWSTDALCIWLRLRLCDNTLTSNITQRLLNFRAKQVGLHLDGICGDPVRFFERYWSRSMSDVIRMVLVAFSIVAVTGCVLYEARRVFTVSVARPLLHEAPYLPIRRDVHGSRRRCGVQRVVVVGNS